MMPRLSETLTIGPKSINNCQSCGLLLPQGDQLSRWMEHDDQDRPEPIVVVLCRKCSDKLIEPHPRLYRQLQLHEPMPGAMPICAGCRHQNGVRCANPEAQINGGPGLNMKFDTPPSRVHVCRSPRRQSGWQTIYYGPVTLCTGRET